ncbi:hypothetical protein BGZ80_008070, partial [Entomortierella chlamydospora]
SQPRPTMSQPQPPTEAHSKANVKKERNSKKRLKKNNGERSHPAESGQMDDIQLTWGASQHGTTIPATGRELSEYS